jgi:uncharacterized protein (DUF433 family)
MKNSFIRERAPCDSMVGERAKGAVMGIVIESHIHLDDNGVAWIDDTNTKVIEVVLDHLAYGWSPEEIHFQHPHLSLAQIHAALSYYHDHQAALDAEIQRQLAEVETLKNQAGESPIHKRLKEIGKLP